MTVISNSNIILNLIYLTIAIAIIIGSIFAFRFSVSKTASEIQERVINALNSEIKSLTDRISAVEQENGRLKQTLGLIKSALKKRGLAVSIDGDLITISDAQGNATHTGRITSTTTTTAGEDV